VKTYIPALRFHFATGLYDPVVRWTTREAAFKAALVAGLAPRDGERILDLGCGTGTLAIAISRAAPGAAVVGIDADDSTLARARAKQARSGTSVQWQRGLAQELPFRDGAFDAVVSSLFFHHLLRPDKRAALAEIARVIRPNGRLLIADWGRPANPACRLLFLTVQLLDGFATTRDSVEGVLPLLMAESGFEAVRIAQQFSTALGTLAVYSGSRSLHFAGCNSVTV
jgi:SAM-dependent methyltransferase